jgi:hypothetical protein
MGKSELDGVVGGANMGPLQEGKLMVEEMPETAKAEVRFEASELPPFDRVFSANWLGARVRDGDVEFMFGQEIGNRVMHAIIMAMSIDAVRAAFADRSFLQTVTGNVTAFVITPSTLSLASSLDENSPFQLERAQLVSVEVSGNESSLRFVRIAHAELRRAALLKVDPQLERLVFPVIEILMSTVDLGRLIRTLASVVPEMYDPFAEAPNAPA